MVVNVGLYCVIEISCVQSHCLCEGTKITYLEATDPDDDEVLFNLVGNARVLAEGPLLRVVNTARQRASVYLNAPLNALVRTHTHTHTHTHTRLSICLSICLSVCVSVCVLTRVARIITAARIETCSHTSTDQYCGRKPQTRLI